jgi:hypothetical protein
MDALNQKQLQWLEKYKLCSKFFFDFLKCIKNVLDYINVLFFSIVKAFLAETFESRIFGRQMDILPYLGYDFPPRSPDLTVMDFYLFGRMKDAITEDPMPTTLALLRAKIIQVYDSITPEEIRAAFANIQVCKKLLFI